MVRKYEAVNEVECFKTHCLSDGPCLEQMLVQCNGGSEVVPRTLHCGKFTETGTGNRQIMYYDTSRHFHLFKCTIN